MNQHQPVMSQPNAGGPYIHGRGQQTLPYTPPPYPQHPQHYPGYAYHYPYQYSRPPPQWVPYPMQVPMGRGYQPYPPMNTYQPVQHYPPPRPSPHPQASSSSIHSPQMMPTPPPPNVLTHTPPPAPVLQPLPPRPPAPSWSSPTLRSPSRPRKNMQPPLPWQSFEGTFPRKTTPRRRRRRELVEDVELPSPPEFATKLRDSQNGPPESTFHTDSRQMSLTHPSGLAPSETPPTSNPPSEVVSTQPTTPTSSAPTQQTTPKASAFARPSGASAPIVPVVPNLPLAAKPAKKDQTHFTADEDLHDDSGEHEEEQEIHDQGTYDTHTSVHDSKTSPVTTKSVPKSWADMVRRRNETASGTSKATTEATAHANGVIFSKSKSLEEIINAYDVKTRNGAKISFIEPRGLVNTGNMCYMNSVLQTLLFCVPFFSFLENVGKQATHHFNSDTPMMDAMIMFMREFPTIDAADSVDQLRMRLKDHELEQYGESFTPEFIYDVTRRLPRFATMTRGHQQDAEEFLGFLLEELHEECNRAMKKLLPGKGLLQQPPEIRNGGLLPPAELSSNGGVNDENAWLEVGRKQKAAVTRTSGHIATESPITKIFGGKLRSELKIPGMKSSVTLEPYQPLQLDIGGAHVHDITDALKGLTLPETLHGDFQSPRGPGSVAVKQVTIETLPQVLILHLKRFQYDNAGGTQKIWKKVGYPLHLEIPKEVFPQHKRGALLAHGNLPKYRLIGVVFHHGKDAGSGHYTVNVQRQDEREWIGFDDTHIRRIRSEDVAAQGSVQEEKSASSHSKSKSEAAEAGKVVAESNRFEQIAANDFASTDERHQVTGESSQTAQENGTRNEKTAIGKKWSTVANGNVTPKSGTPDMSRTTLNKSASSVKDGKVAYILVYQREDSL